MSTHIVQIIVRWRALACLVAVLCALPGTNIQCNRRQQWESIANVTLS